MNDKPFLVGTPELDIQRSESNSWGLVIKSKSRGKDQEMAQKNAKEILYSVDQKDSLLIFQPWYVIPGQSMWHLQNIHVILKVPEGKTIFLDDNMGKIIHDIENTSNTLDDEMVGKYWTMTADGLDNAGSKRRYPHYPALPSAPRTPH